jgi:hypothetical protein
MSEGMKGEEDDDDEEEVPCFPTPFPLPSSSLTPV